MLIGKIIKISWFGSRRWRLNIDGTTKMFDGYHAMNSWLVGIVGKVKDRYKRKLLLDDLSKFLILEDH